MTRNKDSTRFYSSKQEEYVAKLLNGRTVSNSGAAKFTCGDVISDDFIIECKTKMKPSESFSIKKQWLIDRFTHRKPLALAMGQGAVTINQHIEKSVCRA